MHRVSFRHIPLHRRPPFAGWSTGVHLACFALFALDWLAVCAGIWFPQSWLGRTAWADWTQGLLLVFATASTLAGMTRQLPGQNVMLVSVLVALLGGLAHGLTAKTGIPFGPCKYSERLGQRLFDALPWAFPMIWVVVLLNSRGVARLILRRWRTTPVYGLWVLALTAGLVVLLDLGMEPFANQVTGYWSWGATRIASTWYGAPWVNFLGWLVVALLVLLFVTPWILNKSAAKRPPDFYPLWLWLALNVLFFSGAIQHQLWWAAGVSGAAAVIAGGLAFYGTRSNFARKPAAQGSSIVPSA